MVQFSHFQKVLEKPRKRKKNIQNEEGSDEDSSEDMETEVIHTDPSNRRSEFKKSRGVYEFDEYDDEVIEQQLPKAPIVKAQLIVLSDEETSQSILKSKVYESVKQEIEGEGAFKFTNEEVESALHKMQDNNQIFLSGDLVILV